MKLNAFLKGLIMAIVGFIAMTIKEHDTFNLTYVAFTTGFFTIGYVLKNWLFPSLSNAGKLGLRDLLSGLFIAINMAASDFAAQLLVVSSVDWNALWVSMLGAIIGYFTKTIPHNAKK